MGHWVQGHMFDDASLRAVARQGKTEEVKKLIALGADIDTSNGYPLCLATYNGHTETVKALLALGADVHANNDYALRLAIEYGRTEIAELLKGYGAKNQEEVE